MSFMNETIAGVDAGAQCAPMTAAKLAAEDEARREWLNEQVRQASRKMQASQAHLARCACGAGYDPRVNGHTACGNCRSKARPRKQPHAKHGSYGPRAP